MNQNTTTPTKTVTEKSKITKVIDDSDMDIIRTMHDDQTLPDIPEHDDYDTDTTGLLYHQYRRDYYLQQIATQEYADALEAERQTTLATEGHGGCRR